MHAETNSARPRRPRGEWAYYPGARFHPAVERHADDPVATIGEDENCDFIQQPWPTEPTLIDIGQQYLTEWVIPQKCDLQRTAHCLFQAYRVWGSHRLASSFNRGDGRDFVNMRRADGVSDATIRGAHA